MTKECPICLDPLSEVDFELECKHSVHLECMKENFTKFECPMCRSPITQSYLPPAVRASIKRNARKFKTHQETEEYNDVVRMVREEMQNPNLVPPVVTTSQLDALVPEMFMQIFSQFLHDSGNVDEMDEMVSLNFRMPIPRDWTPSQRDRFRRNIQQNIMAQTNPYNNDNAQSHQ